MEQEIKQAVRERYAGIARQNSSCCGPGSSCCGNPVSAEVISGAIGYTRDDMKSVPSRSNLGLGCGNPVALASLKEGEIVLDLGSGAGFDCFLAAHAVGSQGRVIGVDMTPDMLALATINAKKNGYENVEFRLGEIENLPVADSSVDVVISNCVINLSTDKKRVFSEAFRALKPGGRLMVSDIVLLKMLPEEVQNSPQAYVNCISGASVKEEYLATIKLAGFKEIEILDETPVPVEYYPCISGDDKRVEQSAQAATLTLNDSAVSIKISAIKPV